MKYNSIRLYRGGGSYTANEIGCEWGNEPFYKGHDVSDWNLEDEEMG